MLYATIKNRILSSLGRIIWKSQQRGGIANNLDTREKKKKEKKRKIKQNES